MATSLGSLRSSYSYPSSSSSIHGFCIYTDFYYEAIEPGKTKITWDFIAGYDNYGSYPATSTYASAGITISLSATKGIISEITGTSYSGTGIKYKDWPTLKSGSCIITHDSSGEAGFNVYADVSVGGWECDSSGSFSLPSNIPYTKCGAPTSISASGIITPSGSFTVSWSGATAGHANAISGYRVYYSLTSNGASPTTTTTTYKDVGASVTSATFALSGATRGYKVVCGVVTKGSVSGYDSSIKTGGLVIINSLPAAPTASVNKTIIPSTNGQVTFNITAGADNDTSQTKTLYYSTSTTGTKTKITSPWSPMVTKETTYYFWTYDGLEYSSSPSSGITIFKNEKPTFSVSISSQSLISVNNSSGYNYTITPTITLENISGGQSNKKYIYKLLYGTNTSTTSSKVLYNLDSATQKTISDVRSLGIGHESSGAYYRFSVQCYDGIEYSEVKTTDIRYVTKVPSLIGLYNKSDFTNINGFYSGNIATYYSKFLGFVFQRDNGYNILSFKNYDGTIKTISLSTNNSDTRGAWTNSDNLTSSTYYNLSYQIGYNSGYTYSAKTQNITKIGTVSLNNFVFGRQNFRFFIDSGVYANTVGHSYASSPLTSGSLKGYGIATVLSSTHFTVKIYSNNNWSSSFSISPNTATTNNNTIGFNISSTILADATTNLFSSAQKNTNYAAIIRLYITNDFGDQSYIDASFTIIFKANDSIALSSFSISPFSNSNTIDKWQYLKEGMGTLVGNFTITSYNTNPKGEVQILRSTESNWQTLKTFNFSGSGTAAPNSPVTYTASDVSIQTIGEISNLSYSVSYRIIINTDAGSIIKELYTGIAVRGHVPATLIIQNHSYDGTNLTIGYNVNFGADTVNLKLGNDNEISLYLDGETTAKSTYTDNSNYFDTSSKTAIFSYDFGESESSLIKLGITTELSTYLKTDNSKSNPEFTTTKDSNLDAIIASPVFNILPTVAYRKNHLGINVLNPSSDTKSDAIIVIGETSGRDTIYFQPASTNLCKVVNFHLDGGTW